MLDADLAALYQVEVKVLNQAVKRNRERFPADFMFRLTDEEAASLRSQIVTSKVRRGGRRSAPYAFTEQGVAMLSSVLRSTRAIRVNIDSVLGPGTKPGTTTLTRIPSTPTSRANVWAATVSADLVAA